MCNLCWIQLSAWSLQRDSVACHPTNGEQLTMSRLSVIQKAGMGILSAVLLTSNAVRAEKPEAVRGVVKSVQEAVLSVDLNARVLDTPVMAGESFLKDDVLLKFDCEIQRAEARAAKAHYSASKSAHGNNIELQQYGAIGEFDVKVSKAEMQKALAEAEAISARTKDCEILAPFDGRVAELAINAYETPGPNQPLLKIVSSDAYEVHLIVPSSWLSWLRNGSTMEFVVDETGVTHQASVRRLGAEVDAVSRTVPVIAGFTTLPAPVLPGMSGTAQFTGPVQ